MANEMNLIPQDDYIAICDEVRRRRNFSPDHKLTSSELLSDIIQMNDANSLVDGTISYFNMSGVTVIRPHAFHSVGLLDISNVNDLQSIGEYAFYDTSLEDSTYMSFGSLVSIGEYTFAAGQVSPKRMGSAEFLKLKIVPEYAFAWRYLNAIWFGEAHTVEINGMRECQAIKITFEKLTSINADGFLDCTRLKTLIIKTPTVCTLGNPTCFVGTPIQKGTGYIYVPKALIEQYKIAPNWVNYDTQFRAIEDYPDIVNS